MQSWELFKALIREVGLYRKKLLFFLLLVAVVLGVVFLWQKYRQVEAAVELNAPETGYTNQVNLDVIITKDAEVLINNKKDNRVLKFYDNYDEVKILVFNSPGYFIQNFQAIIHLPAPATESNLRQLIYAVHGVGSNGYFMLDPETLVYQASDISPQAVLTIVADLPKGMVKASASQELQFKVGELPLRVWLYVGIILPSITIILMTFMIFKRRSAQFFLIQELSDQPPAKEPPSVVGVLLSGTVGAREIAATLVSLASRRFILIVNKGKGQFSFGKRRSGDYEKMKDLLPFEKVLLDKIFLSQAYRSTLDDVEMRIGRHIFSRKIAQFYLGVYNFATKKGYFVKNPAKVHLSYKYAGIILLFLSLIGFAVGAFAGADPKFGLIFWVGGMGAAFFIIKLSPFMPARARFGTDELKKWLAFRKYLASRKPLQAKEVLQGKFEEYLPYAIAFGVEVEWANRFLKEPFTKPDWYDSAERVITLESFVGQFFPFIGYVADNLAKSHEPTVE